MGINMSSKNRSENVPEILLAFMKEMNAWENDFFDRRKQILSKGLDDSKLKNEYAKRLGGVLNKYVVKDKANYGRLIDLGCTKPATYDSDTDEIKVLEKGDVSLTVQMQQVRGAETVSRIYLVHKKDGWKIKKKEILTFDEKWRRAPL
ncbi:Immunity protein RhsIA [compost metagenome]